MYCLFFKHLYFLFITIEYKMPLNIVRFGYYYLSYYFRDQTLCLHTTVFLDLVLGVPLKKRRWRDYTPETLVGRGRKKICVCIANEFEWNKKDTK